MQGCENFCRVSFAGPFLLAFCIRAAQIFAVDTQTDDNRLFGLSSDK